MAKLAVYDPPMCCSTGVCGPAVNESLVRFAADLDWLRQRGVTVKRFNLSQEPHAFVENAAVTSALREGGSQCLPLILVDGNLVSKGEYPSRETLATWMGVEVGA